MKYQSRFDPTRQTMGAIALEARKNTTPIECGDMTNEMIKSLVDDLNETIQSNPFEGRPFYISVVEKKDYLLPNAIHRGMVTTMYRPYPENNTIVFHCDPKTNVVKLCWTLPHWSEMDNMLNNQEKRNLKLVSDIYAWKTLNLEYFGFSRDEKDIPYDNGHYRNDQVLKLVSKSSPTAMV
jgi:hypothetical protein